MSLRCFCAEKIQKKKEKKPYILSIDPGLGGTGFALWLDGKLQKVGIIKPRSTDSDYYDRGMSIAEGYNNLLVEIEPKRSDVENLNVVYIEYPAFFGGAGGTMVAARGDLVKLSWIAGTICGLSIARNWIPIMVNVHDWKGQLPKDVVISRIKDKYPEVGVFDIQSHAWDAVGIGLYAQGRF